jgi:hypothetical protein
MDLELYKQSQRLLVKVRYLLEEVRAEIGNSLKADRKETLKSVQTDLEAAEARIKKSMERNEVEGVQNARTDIIHPDHGEDNDQKRSRKDSGFASSIRSMEIYPKIPSPISGTGDATIYDDLQSPKSKSSLEITQHAPSHQATLQPTQPVSRPKSPEHRTDKICGARM